MIKQPTYKEHSGAYVPNSQRTIPRNNRSEILAYKKIINK